MRKLHPDLKAWFDSRLLNPEPLPFHDPKNPVKMFLLTALAANGVSEIGDNRGPLIELFQSTIGKPEGEPWCMSFIQSCVAYVESFGFKSAVFPSEHCLTVWTNSTTRRPIEPTAGDMVIYRLGDSTRGHAEIITAVNARTYSTIGGNTSDSAEIEREGEGVFQKERLRGGYKTMRELGFLRVFEL